MKDLILEWIDAQFGRILLALALIWTGYSIYTNRPDPLPKELTNAQPRPVYVELDSKNLAAASSEVYYAAGPVDAYNRGNRFVFVAEKVERQFTPVDLEIPTVTIKRPPQLLPEPGPSLEGAENLPRYGDEFQPVTQADLTPAPKSGSGSSGTGTTKP